MAWWNPRRIGEGAGTARLAWLEQFARRDGVTWLSEARAFSHDEGEYDAQYASEADRPEVGQGAVALMRALDADLGGPALEVACGTGLLSVGLAAAGAYPGLIVTDASPRFLELTRRKLARNGLEDRARYAVLRFEDLPRLPAETLSLVVLRSALHHVLDVERFVADTARLLRPGGVLAFQEPCAEGNVLMGALAHFVPMVMQAAGHAPTARQREQLRLFEDTIRFYARRDVDKAAAEDKHLFRPHELVEVGRGCGLEVRFLPNVVFEDCVGGLPPARRPGSFFGFFHDYLRYCMAFDAELVTLFSEHFARHCALVEELSRTGDGPAMHGVFACRKSAGRPGR
jgi:ubiquinone/menaquinone biosynthesis C-methylase UbiE